LLNCRRIGLGVLLGIVVASGVEAQLPMGGGGETIPIPPPVGPTGLALGLETGLFHQADDLVSPLRYAGVGFGASIRVGFSSLSAIRSVTLSYTSPRLESRATEEGEHVQEGSRSGFELLALRRFGSFRDGRLSFLMGGALSGQFALYDHRYTRTDEESWLHAFGLLEPGIGWSATLPWGGQLWQAVTVPLFGLVFRPGWEGLTEAPKGVWVGPGEVEGFQQSLNYQQPVGGRFRLGISYGFRTLRYSEPRTLALSASRLSLFGTLWERGRGP
jgi:hypothetical protein